MVTRARRRKPAKAAARPKVRKSGARKRSSAERTASAERAASQPAPAPPAGPNLDLMGWMKAVSPEKLFSEMAALSSEWGRIAAGSSELKHDPRDARFRDPAWATNPAYRQLGQWYLAVTQSMSRLAAEPSPDGDWRAEERRKLAVDVLNSALSPTNTLLGNPEAIKRAMETGGASLADGMNNWMQDVANKRSTPSQVDATPFKVGENLAVTPGAVVYRSDVLELLQYQPTTTTVHARPVIIVPPQINKYYFLDLAPKRSFAEFLVSQGFQTFMISWRNPTKKQRDWNLDTYAAATLEAMTVAQEITKSAKIDAIGVCAGGITLSGLVGALAERGDRRVATLSLAVTLLDWSQRSALGALQDPQILKKSAENSRKQGILKGSDLASIFSWLRPNDLVWNYWVNNYLLGKPPPRFDVLAWNEDSTNMPAALHHDFLHIFGDNPFSRPGEMKVLGEPIDLSHAKCDAFITGAINDHLTPWEGTYRSTQLLGGKSTFVLSNAGHIASLVNPPDNPKASYRTAPINGDSAKEWLQRAKENTGSWWSVWADWAKARSRQRKAAPRSLGSRKWPALEAAPGRYIFERAS